MPTLRPSRSSRGSLGPLLILLLGLVFVTAVERVAPERPRLVAHLNPGGSAE